MSRLRPPRPLTAVSTAFGLASGLLMLALMLLTVADVVSRNVADRSILGTVDISTLLLVMVAFLGLSAAEIDGRHVSVSLVEDRLGGRTRLVLSALRSVLMLLIGVLMVWGLAEVLFSAIDRSETTNDILRLATWPAKLVLFVSFLLFFVSAVWRQAVELRARLSGEPVGTEGSDAAEAADAPVTADAAPEPVSAARHDEEAGR